MRIINHESEGQALEVGENPSKDIAALLDRAIEALERVWPSTSPVVQRLQGLRDRLLSGRLQLAVLGQFKRGKSTLLNALLGAPLLPAGVIPLTAIPTFIAWDGRPRIRVTYHSGNRLEEFDVQGPDEIRGILFNFVAEEANPKNRLEVARVDLFYPAPILENGVVLIDTPGIGSTHRHNTDSALEVLPECDAALFVVSADPPITEAELAYLNAVRPKVGRLFFILNKADYLDTRDLQIAAEFLRQTLQRSEGGANDEEVFCVSALAGLKARQNADALSLEKSGIVNLEDHLLRHLAHEKLTLLRVAVVQKAKENLAEAKGDLALKLRALEMPVEDLRRCGENLQQVLLRITDDSRVIHDLLAGDRRRILGQIESHAEHLRERGSQHFMEVLERTFARSDEPDVEGAARQAIESSVPAFFKQELDKGLREVGRVTDELLASHYRRVDDLVNQVRRTATELFDVPYTPATQSEGFRLPREPYWVTQQWADGLVTVPTGLVNRLLPARARRARLRAQIETLIAELVQRNVENIRWATLQGIEETFRRFSTALDERFAGAIDATQGAVQAAFERRSVASDGAAPELAQLRCSSTELDDIRTALVDITSVIVDQG